MVNTFCRLLATFAVAVVLSPLMQLHASAAVVLAPESASTDMGEYFPASQTRDRSGLSVNYQSLVSDFDVYIASAPTSHHGFGTNIWSSFLDVRSGNFDFALGGNYLISGMAFWNLFEDSASVKDIRILLDSNISFSSAIDLGVFTASNSLGPQSDVTAAQVFSFAATSASYVRLQILNTWSPVSTGAAFNEAAFRVSSVPEPAIIVLWGLGLAYTAGSLRQRKRAVVSSVQRVINAH